MFLTVVFCVVDIVFKLTQLLLFDVDAIVFELTWLLSSHDVDIVFETNLTVVF